MTGKQSVIMFVHSSHLSSFARGSQVHPLPIKFTEPNLLRSELILTTPAPSSDNSQSLPILGRQAPTPPPSFDSVFFKSGKACSDAPNPTAWVQEPQANTALDPHQSLENHSVEGKSSAEASSDMQVTEESAEWAGAIAPASDLEEQKKALPINPRSLEKIDPCAQKYQTPRASPIKDSSDVLPSTLRSNLKRVEFEATATWDRVQTTSTEFTSRLLAVGASETIPRSKIPERENVLESAKTKVAAPTVALHQAADPETSQLAPRHAVFGDVQSESQCHHPNRDSASGGGIRSAVFPNSARTIMNDILVETASNLSLITLSTQREQSPADGEMRSELLGLPDRQESRYLPTGKSLGQFERVPSQPEIPVQRSKPETPKTVRHKDQVRSISDLPNPVQFISGMAVEKPGTREAALTELDPAEPTSDHGPKRDTLNVSRAGVDFVPKQYQSEPALKWQAIVQKPEPTERTFITEQTVPVHGSGTTAPQNRPTHHGLRSADTPVQLIRQIADAVPLSANRTVEITLSPEELGRVRMLMTTTDAGVVVSIASDRPDTLDLMRRHIDLLGREFDALGYESVSFSFSDGMQNDANNDGDHLSDRSKRTAHTSDEASENAAEIHLDIGTVSGLDLRL